MSLRDVNLGTIAFWERDLGTLAPRTYGLGSLPPASADMGLADFPFIYSPITDPILALNPVWAFDALTSLVGYSHLDPVDEALDLVGTNHAVQADSAKRPIYDATYQNGRGAIYGVTQTILKRLQTLQKLDPMSEWTIVLVHTPRDFNRYTGVFSLRADELGNTLTGFIIYTDQTFIRTSGQHSASTMVAPSYGSLGAFSGDRQNYLIRSKSEVGVAPQLYVNGKLAQASGPTDNWANITGDWRVTLGQGYYTGFLNGWISAAYIFNRALDDADRDIVSAELESRWPGYYRNALPQAWSHFQFNDGLGSTVAEDAAGGIPAGGTLQNAVAIRSPMGSDSNPTGFNFDGVNDRVDLAAGSLDWVQTSLVFTLEAFVMPDALTTSSALAGSYVGAGTADCFIWDVVESGALTYVRFVGVSNTARPIEIPVGQPAPLHIVSVGNGSTVTHYVDGSAIGAATVAYPGTAGGNVTSLGSSGLAGRYWNGKINEINFHKVALTPAEIQARTRLYRGDLGQRLIDGIGSGGTGFRHLFMNEEIRGETTFIDRITGDTGTHLNGVVTGSYSPIRGTTRAAFFDGVNDKGSFDAADLDLDMSSAFTIFMLGTKTSIAATTYPMGIWDVATQKGAFFAAHSSGYMRANFGNGTSTYLFNNATVMTDQVSLIALSSDPATETLSLVTVIDSGLSRVDDVSRFASYDFTTPGNLGIMKLDGIGGSTSGGTYGPLGFVNRALTDDELQWIYDIGKWS